VEDGRWCIYYTHLAKNYFEKFMLTDPNQSCTHSNFAFILT
jgi:hypothetical protein